jgi:hypothetical protein
MDLRAPIERPSLLWRGFVVTGVATMKALSFSDTAWAWWEEHITDKIPRNAIRGLLAGTLVLHFMEARSARRLALEAHVDHVPARVLSTFAWGFPAYRATKRAAEGAVLSGAATFDD